MNCFFGPRPIRWGHPAYEMTGGAALAEASGEACLIAARRKGRSTRLIHYFRMETAKDRDEQFIDFLRESYAMGIQKDLLEGKE